MTRDLGDIALSIVVAFCAVFLVVFVMTFLLLSYDSFQANSPLEIATMAISCFVLFFLLALSEITLIFLFLAVQEMPSKNTVVSV